MSTIQQAGQTMPGTPLNLPKMPRLKMPKWPEVYGLERMEVIPGTQFRVCIGPRQIELEYMQSTDTVVGVKVQPMRLAVGSAIGDPRAEFGDPLGLAVYDLIVKYKDLLDQKVALTRENTAMKALLDEKAALEAKSDVTSETA